MSPRDTSAIATEMMATARSVFTAAVHGRPASESSAATGLRPTFGRPDLRPTFRAHVRPPQHASITQGDATTLGLKRSAGSLNHLNLGGVDAGPGRSDAGDVGGEEVDAVTVEVAAGTVVVLGSPRVAVPGDDLRIAERDAGGQGRW